MTIKSDKWIKKQSTPPSFMVTDLIPQAQHPGGMGGYYLPQKTEYMSNRSEESLKRAVSDSQYSDSGIKAYRPLTAEELSTYVPMISPFEPGNIRTKPVYDQAASRDMDTDIMVDQKILSYGTSSFGYDVTLQDEFRIFTNINSSIIDPLNFDENCLVAFKGDVCIIPPNSYILGVTRERFVVPRNVMIVCVGKSTYARCGAIVNVTPIEPGFDGNVVIEISNATNLPMKVYANQGIAQFLFFESDEECETSYKDKGGKYQGQTGMTLAKG